MVSNRNSAMSGARLSGIVREPIKADTWIYALSFLTVFVDVSSVIETYAYIRYLMLLIVGIFICLKLTVIVSDKNWLSLVPWLVFFAVVSFSTFLSRDDYTSRNPFLAAIVALGGLLEFIAVINYAFEKRRLRSALNVFYVVALIVLLITDVTVYFSGIYLIGNKFRIAYFHVLFVVLFVIRKAFFKNSKSFINQTLFVGLIILTFAICLKVDCTTGINAIVLMIVWFILGRIFPLFVYNPITASVTVVLSYVFMYIATSFLHITFVANYIVDTLHKDVTMTGRLLIFEVVPKVLSRKPLLGYGYGVSYEVLDFALKGAPDTQNALAEWILYGGYITAIIIILLIALNFKTALTHASTNNVAMLICVAFVYAFICIGTVEISYGMDFFAVLALLRVISLSINQRKG